MGKREEMRGEVGCEEREEDRRWEERTLKEREERRSEESDKRRGRRGEERRESRGENRSLKSRSHSVPSASVVLAPSQTTNEGSHH